ncbi:hypothetical protein BH11GEM2_BH11GEM2_36170 [soil metagenome]
MIYEELKLRPPNGSTDHNAITAWLETKDTAFLDPIEHRIWHLSANKQEMEVNRRERIATPTRMPNGVFVLLLPDHVSVNAYWAANAEGRAREFIRWLASKGDWMVQRDQRHDAADDGDDREPGVDQERLGGHGTNLLTRF